MKLVLSIFKWLLVAIIALLILLFAYANYTIYSFDTETLSEKYGEVEAKLFLSEGSNQPLVVGLGDKRSVQFRAGRGTASRRRCGATGLRAECGGQVHGDQEPDCSPNQKRQARWAKA